MDKVAQVSSSRPQSKPAGGSGSQPFDFSHFVVPNFALPKFEIPADFRDFAEKSSSQAQQAYEKWKTAAEEATDRFNDAYLNARKGSADLGVQLIEAARVNLNIVFDYAVKLLATKSLSEVVELSTVHLRKQFEAVTEQSKELTSLAQKIANETGEPIKEGLAKAFKQAA